MTPKKYQFRSIVLHNVFPLLWNQLEKNNVGTSLGVEVYTVCACPVCSLAPTPSAWLPSPAWHCLLNFFHGWRPPVWEVMPSRERALSKGLRRDGMWITQLPSPLIPHGLPETPQHELDTFLTAFTFWTQFSSSTPCFCLLWYKLRSLKSRSLRRTLTKTFKSSNTRNIIFYLIDNCKVRQAVLDSFYRKKTNFPQIINLEEAELGRNSTVFFPWIFQNKG